MFCMFLCLKIMFCIQLGDCVAYCRMFAALLIPWRYHFDTLFFGDATAEQCSEISGSVLLRDSHSLPAWFQKNGTF